MYWFLTICRQLYEAEVVQSHVTLQFVPNMSTRPPRTLSSTLSSLCILTEILLRAHVKGAKKKKEKPKNLTVSNLALLLVVFRVTARRAWQ